MTYSALTPVSEAVYAVLLDSTLQAATAGGWYEVLLQPPTFPCGWFELLSATEARGFGTGGLPLIELRTHTFSAYGSLSEAQAIDRLVIGLFRDVALTVSGYTFCGRIFYDRTVTLPDEVLNGVPVHEVVSFFRLYVEES